MPVIRAYLFASESKINMSLLNSLSSFWCRILRNVGWYLHLCCVMGENILTKNFDIFLYFWTMDNSVFFFAFWKRSKCMVCSQWKYFTPNFCRQKALKVKVLCNFIFHFSVSCGQILHIVCWLQLVRKKKKNIGKFKGKSNWMLNHPLSWLFNSFWFVVPLMLNYAVLLSLSQQISTTPFEHNLDLARNTNHLVILVLRSPLVCEN